MLRQRKRRLIAPLLFAQAVALQFGIHIARAENMDQLFDLRARCIGTAASAAQRKRERSFVAARQADQACSVLRYILERSRGLALIAVRLAQLDLGKQPAEI